jgi:S-formylglutathione hydrolase FrmB
VIVGIDHGGAARIRELAPFHGRRRGQAAHLIRWIARDLAPKIQREFGTRRDVAGTAIGGSSMGGLAALYAHFHRPDVFGSVLCMSPSLWFARGKIFPFVAGEPPLDLAHLPRRRRPRGRVGARQSTGAPPAGPRLRRHDLRWVPDPHGHHREQDWRRRAPGALEFLFAHQTSRPFGPDHGQASRAA